MAQRYIATEPIFLGRARVANAGDVIPESHPKFDEWEEAGLVAAEGTNAAQDAPGLFDPSAHTVGEVNAHLADSDDAERDRVLAAERAGRNRSTIEGIAD